RSRTSTASRTRRTSSRKSPPRSSAVPCRCTRTMADPAAPEGAFQKPVKVTIDGREIVAEAGTPLLQVALDNGIDIPHYCYHPKLSIDGSCRMCQVKIEKAPKLQIACNTPVADGMIVDTQAAEVAEARKGVMELLLINHPLDCPICD